MNKHINESVKNPDNTAILNAYRFLDDICEQIQSLRKTLKSQLKESSKLEKLRIKVDKFKEDYEINNSDWIYRTQMDTFEISKNRANAKPSILGAFQISLYPDGGIDDSSKFIPYLAVLLCEAEGCEQWEAEEFQLGNEFSPVSDEGEDGYWEKSDKSLQWKSTDAFATVFVVPLVDLQNAKDTQNKVIDVLFKEIETMLKEIG